MGSNDTQNKELLEQNNFPSVVNTVYPDQHSRYGSVVVKEYSDKAVKTGIKLPIERALIEHRVYTWLKDELACTPYLSVPEVLEFQYSERPRLILQHVNAFPLKNQPETIKDAHITSIMNLLKKIEAGTDHDRIFNGLWKEQEACRQALLRYKFPNLHIDEEPSVLCLGDLSPNNILISDSTAYLIDFEFSHVGYIGYDLGQLTGSIKSLSQPIFDNAEHMPSCNPVHQFWRNKFIDRYQGA